MSGQFKASFLTLTSGAGVAWFQTLMIPVYINCLNSSLIGGGAKITEIKARIGSETRTLEVIKGAKVESLDTAELYRDCK